MLNFKDLEIVNAVAENGFDKMDYNNQVNFMWCMVDMVMADEAGKRYDWTRFPYEQNATLALADVLPRAGTEKLRGMAMKLKDFGAKTKLTRLIAA